MAMISEESYPEEIVMIYEAIDDCMSVVVLLPRLVDALDTLLELCCFFVGEARHDLLCARVNHHHSIGSHAFELLLVVHPMRVLSVHLLEFCIRLVPTRVCLCAYRVRSDVSPYRSISLSQ